MVDELSDEELLQALEVSVAPTKTGAYTPRQERVIAGFEDIVKFFEQHGRAPQHGEGNDIFERIYAVRLDRLREQADCRNLLLQRDKYGLLKTGQDNLQAPIEALDDDALLAELGGLAALENDISQLKHVKPRSEVRAAEEVASRRECVDFESFKPLFAKVKSDLEIGASSTQRFTQMAGIKQGEFFIVGGQIAYVAEVGDEFFSEYDRRDSRLRVIYDNGTESDVLLRSLQRALHRDETGRRVIALSAGPLFGDDRDDDDFESGTIYVLRSQSDHPDVAAHRELIHKIGVTGGKVETRIANAATDATYLLAAVEVVATYQLFNINRSRLENLLHRVFASARLELVINDRFGNPVQPKEWFLVPLSVIDQVVEKIRDRTITQFEYEPSTASLKAIAEM